MGAGPGVLLVDLDGVDKPDLFEGLVPLQHPLAHPPAISHRRRVLKIEDNGLLGRAEFELGVGLFQLPAVDVANPRGIGSGLAHITVRRGEVADTSISIARLISGALGQHADRIVERPNAPVSQGKREGKLDVLGERLRLGDFGQVVRCAFDVSTEELGGLPDEQRVHVDHGASIRSHRGDGHAEQDTVGEDTLPALLRFQVAGCTDRDIRLNEGQLLVVPLPVRVSVAVLDASPADASGDGVGDEQALLLEAARQLGQHLVFLFVHPNRVQRLGAVSGGDHLLVVFGDLLERRELRLLLLLLLRLLRRVLPRQGPAHQRHNDQSQDAQFSLSHANAPDVVSSRVVETTAANIA